MITIAIQTALIAVPAILLLLVLVLIRRDKVKFDRAQRQAAARDAKIFNDNFNAVESL